MKKLYFLPAAALTALLCGCSSDDALEEGGSPKPVGEGECYYVSITINTDGDTSRAGSNADPDDNDTDFQIGEGEENAVGSAYFVFYDKDGKVVGEPAELTNFTESGATTNTIEKVLTAVVPVQVRVGENLPTKVLCYINPISKSSIQQDLAVMQTVERSTVHDGGAVGSRKFAMSSSVHYHGTGDVDPTYASDVPDGALFSTEADALAELNKDSSTKVVKVWVERYASKLTFQVPESASDYAATTRFIDRENGGYQSTPTVNLKFVEQKWALNAESKTVYAIKSFRKESNAGVMLAENYKYDDLDAKINANLSNTGDTYKFKWNNEDFHRSYWGMSPAYFTAKYPQVSSDVVPSTLHQTYYSFAQITADGNKPQSSNPTAYYYKPTTVGSNALNMTVDGNPNPAAAMPSVVLIGTYKLTKEDGTEITIPDGKGFYTYMKAKAADDATEEHAIIYGEDGDTPGTSALDGLESMLMRFIAQERVLYTKVEDTMDEYRLLDYKIEGDRNTLFRYLEVAKIEQPVLDVTGKEGEPLKLQENARSLQLKSGATTASSAIYLGTDKGFLEIKDASTTTDYDAKVININDANAQLMQSVGYAYYYTMGKAYFNIPVKHYGWYRKGNKNRETVSGVVQDKDKIEWAYVNVGDFGMVRNHVYNIVVNSITGLASGVGDETNPIVPPATTTDYYVAYAVNILKWAIVPTQTVNL